MGVLIPVPTAVPPIAISDRCGRELFIAFREGIRLGKNVTKR